MSTDPRAWLDEVERRAKEATPGPWTTEDSRNEPEVITAEVWQLDGYGVAQLRYRGDANRSDAIFIAHARTDLPRATAALRAVLDAMDEADNKWHARALSTAVLRRAITDALTSEDPR
jgi:hypothetical protein